MTISKRERIEAVLAGEAPDRFPYSFWTHFPGIDFEPEQIASESARLVDELDVDFIKSMPNGLYSVEDWGIKGDFSDIHGGGAARATEYVVKDPSDWTRIRALDVRAGAFGRELDHFARLVRKLGPDVPVLATVFSPLTIAKKLAGENYRDHLQSHPAAVKRALDAIATTTAGFARAAVDGGCAGVFFATQESTTQALAPELYREFGVPYDHAALDGASQGWFNVLHMHGEDIMFDLLKDYPVDALNWHIGETAPELRAVREAGLSQPVVGGIRRFAITRGDYEAVVSDIAAAVDATGGKGLILSPACVIRHPVDRRLLRRVGDHVKALPVFA